MLVYQADRATIRARHVTTQTDVEFGRDGKSTRVEGGGSCTIVSVRPLLPETHEVVLGLDRKMRLGQFPDGFKLTGAEVQMLLDVGDYFKADLLPAE